MRLRERIVARLRQAIRASGSRRNVQRPATELQLECLDERIVPAGELTEGNAASWSVFASDNAAASIADDSSFVRWGSQSIKFTTASGFDTGIRYPATGSANLNVAAFTHLTFWTYAVNNTAFGFQGSQPIVVLKTSAGDYTYTPQSQMMANKAWKVYRVPLAGDSQWVRTTTGTPNLANVAQLEIHQDTWEYGFAVYYDGMEFVTLSAGLPAAGPPAPPGVNPNAINPKVLLYCFDPVMENLGGVRLHQAYGWQNPVTLTQLNLSDFQSSSHGLVNFQIVDTQVADLHPYFDDGFQNTDATFVTNWANRDFHASAHFDYVRFCAENNIAARIDAGELDEVWIYGPPISGMWESAMGGKGAYWVNGPTQNVPSERAFVMNGWNYERGVGEAIHSYGHRAEGNLDHIYGNQAANLNNNWNKFTFQNRYQASEGGIGNVHFPVNGTSDYDYANTTFVVSNADDWANYPNFTGTTRSINFHEWSPTGIDPQREYLNWWYGHLPHFAGRSTDYYLNNWWRYLVDVDQFKANTDNLVYSRALPVVKIVSPTADSNVAVGIVKIRADAWVDGALGRVDFYIDGVYTATDTIAPYTFDWNTTGLAGQHGIQAKAYELQNGTEGQTPTMSVTVGGSPATANLIGRDPTSGNWYIAPTKPGSSALLLGNWAPTAGWVDVMSGDFDGDGRADVVGRNGATGDWQVSLTRGTTFQTSVWDRWTPNGPGITWADLRVGDFNGDGKSDIAGRWRETGQWWVNLSNGVRFAHTYWASWTGSATPNLTWVDVGVGDLNNDGKADLVGRWKEAGQWWAALSTGSVFSNAYFGSWTGSSLPGVTWVDVKITDLTGDGRADVVGRWKETGQWWIGASNGVHFTNGYWGAWTASATWVDVKLADFTGDGKLDIAGRFGANGQWWVGVSTGSAFANAYFGAWSTNVVWKDVAVADFNNDGKSDLVGRGSGIWATSTSTGTALVDAFSGPPSGDFWQDVFAIVF